MSNKKQFSLKEIELNMIQAMQGRHQQELGNFLTFICTERLAYQVTDKTRFTLEDGQLSIIEEEEEVITERKDESTKKRN